MISSMKRQRFSREPPYASVRAVVVLAEELGDQIGVGAVELHTVIARLLAADGGGDELLLHPLDVLQVISRGTSPPGAMGTPLGLRFCRPVKALLEVAPPWWSWAKILAP